MAKRAFFRIVAKSRLGDNALTSFEGRFNSTESAPTSYAADEIITAWAEVTARLGGIPADVSKFAVLRIEVDEERLFLLDSERQAPHLLSDPIPPEAAVFADRVRSQMDSVGISYPSVRRPGGRCVVLFLERISNLSVEELEEGTLRDAVEGD